jgi:hypothetical protein
MAENGQAQSLTPEEKLELMKRNLQVCEFNFQMWLKIDMFF